MKTLYLECNMGAAGDMLTAALLELCPAPEHFLSTMNGLGLPGVRVAVERVSRCGVEGTHVSVTVDGQEEGKGREDNGESGTKRGHGGEHRHTGLEDIRELINGLALPEEVKENAAAVYARLASAESKVHGVDMGQLHFHEVGTFDAVADVVGVCLLMRELGVDQVITSPVKVGYGRVRCAHGVLPVPAPATAWLLRRTPSYAGDVEGELCTPTGAALLTHFTDRFGRMPVMSVDRIGYGMGLKDFEQANCVRAFLGESLDVAADGTLAAEEPEDRPGRRKDRVTELTCNLDDMSGEMLGFVMELLRTEGALEVFAVPCQMKKNRPGQLLTCLCRPENEESMVRTMLKHTTTFGVRRRSCGRCLLDRESSEVETDYGLIHIKTGSGYGTEKYKPEFRDIATAALQYSVPCREIENAVKAAVKQSRNDQAGKERADQ